MIIYLHDAIIKLNQNVVTVGDDTAYDIDGNEVAYNKEDAELEAVNLKAQAEAAIQAKVDAKQSALNKLMALGLTEEEALALGVK